MATKVLTAGLLISAHRILVVCAGNTCRSPMIAEMLRRFFAHIEREVVVESAGILPESAEGMPANEEWFKIIDETGFDLSGHASRRIDGIGPLSGFDLIICVTQKVADEVVKADIGEAKAVLFTPEGLSDPYKLGTDEYRLCFRNASEVFGRLLTAPQS